MTVILDTSAILSLVCGEIFEKVVEHVTCVVPTRVEEELWGISTKNSLLGERARVALEVMKGRVTVMSSDIESREGEIECAYLAKEQKGVLFVVTDDMRGGQKIERISRKRTQFSTVFIFVLLKKGRLTTKQAMATLERMRIERDWKDNPIYVRAKILLEKYISTSV